MGDDVIDIDWESFLNNNIQIMTLLEQCSTNASDVLADCNSITSTINDMNSQLKSLQFATYDNSMFELCYEHSKNLFKYSCMLEECMAADVYNIIIELPNLENNIALFNREGDNSNLTLPFLVGLGSALQKTKKFKSLGFVLNYGSDYFDEKETIVGDASVALWKNLTKKVAFNAFLKSDIQINNNIYVNAAVGSSIVFVYSFMKNEIEVEEITNCFLKAGLDATDYFVGSVIGGTIGGPAGALVSSAVTYVLAEWTDVLYSFITESYIIDSYYVVTYKTGEIKIIDGPRKEEILNNEKNYIESYNYFEIPKSVDGSDITFDTVLDKYLSNKGLQDYDKLYVYDGVVMDKGNYDTISYYEMYKDWFKYAESIKTENNVYIPKKEYVEMSYIEGYRNDFDECLDRLLEYDFDIYEIDDNGNDGMTKLIQKWQDILENNYRANCVYNEMQKINFNVIDYYICNKKS